MPPAARSTCCSTSDPRRSRSPATCRRSRTSWPSPVTTACAATRWRDVVPALSKLGLAALHGSSPDVGVVGYSLGGGIGWLARKHGMQTNSVQAVELVTADGELVRADHDHEPDLF